VGELDFQTPEGLKQTTSQQLVGGRNSRTAVRHGFCVVHVAMRNQIRYLSASVLLFAGTVVHAAVIDFAAFLTGPNESPANTSPGTGTAFVAFDDLALTLQVNVTFSGLESTTTASHIHAATALPGTGTAGVATETPSFPGFPTGVTSGTYSDLFDLTSLTSFNGAFVTANGGTAAGARTALIAALEDGKAYLNIHTTAHPGGEIRGFLNRVPDGSATLTLFSAALVALVGFGRIRRARAP
jgi:hypothetical protein